MHASPKTETALENPVAAADKKAMRVRRWKDGDVSEFWSPSTPKCWLPERGTITETVSESDSWFGRRETKWDRRHPSSQIAKKARKLAEKKRKDAEEEGAEPPKKKRKTEEGAENKKGNQEQ
jgi:hypothetical protein